MGLTVIVLIVEPLQSGSSHPVDTDVSVRRGGGEGGGR